MKRVLVLGIVLALLAGVMLASVVQSVEPEPASVTVPASRIGDRAVMVAYHDEEGGDLEEASTQTIAVEGLGRTIDALGVARDVLLVRENWTTESAGSTTGFYIDLASGKQVRTEHSVEFREAAFNHDLTATYFYTPSGHPFFDGQGRTYTVGEEILDEELAPVDERCGPAGIGAGWGGSEGVGGLFPNRRFHFHVGTRGCGGETVDDFAIDLIELEQRTWVAQAGTVDGRFAVDVRSEGAYRFPDEIVGPAGLEGAFDDLEGSRTDYVFDVWFSPESPYPILIVTENTRTDRSGDVSSSRSVQTMTKLERGEQEVPWGRTDPVAGARSPERTSGAQTYPADGTGSTLPYGLAAALADVNGPLMPHAFRLWNLQNPGATLVSAELQVGERSPATGALVPMASRVRGALRRCP